MRFTQTSYEPCDLTEAVHNPAKAVVLAEMFIPPSGEIWNSATCSTYVNCTVKQLFAFRGTLLRFTPRLRYLEILNNRSLPYPFSHLFSYLEYYILIIWQQCVVFLFVHRFFVDLRRKDSSLILLTGSNENLENSLPLEYFWKVGYFLSIDRRKLV